MLTIYTFTQLQMNNNNINFINLSSLHYHKIGYQIFYTFYD